MAEIIPAILPKNYEDMKNKIALVKGVVPLVQIDLCDGIFVPSRTWPFSTGGGDDLYFQNIINEREGMPFWEEIEFEFDLMVADAVDNFDIYTKLGPKRIIFHIEAVGNLEDFKNFLDGIDVYIKDSIQLGIAINSTTPAESIFKLVNSVDFVQCMGIEKIGFQGQDFDERVLSQIKILKKEFPDLIIAVDGGVNLNTAPALVSAGADRLIVGSALFNTNDIHEAVEMFERVI